MNFQLVWFDSYGAKSSCTLVETSDTRILIDPGAAAMQPSFPLSESLKASYKEKALHSIVKASKGVDQVVISHYHYDHHTLSHPEIYRDKKLWVKNPNKWINRTQWKRSRLFLDRICRNLGDKKLKDYEVEPQQEEFPDPLNSLDIAREKDFGEYQNRREQLLHKWRKRFNKLVKHWKSHRWVDETELCPTKLAFADGREVHIGSTKLRFSEPLFHGIEYANTGWVFATIIEHKGEKLIHSSDLQGPIIEDYAQWIIQERPDILILDGPTTYLLGYLLNKINLKRSVDNACRIMEESDIRLMIYDHHLLRDPKYRDRTRKIWKYKGKVTTAAEYKGEEPLILKAVRKELE